MTATKLIDIHGLSWSYPKSSGHVFDDLHISLHKHDFCFIVGKSGVGKTTLVKFLIRQIQPPTKMIFHKKEDIARFGVSEVQAYRRNIGVVHQDFKLIERKNVTENVEYPLEILGVKKNNRREKVKKILELLHLDHKADAAIWSLSWGEKQRVAIWRALINNPEFIIADEPTGNLDRTTSKRIADLFISLNKRGHTIVLITHDEKLIDYVQSVHETKTITL